MGKRNYLFLGFLSLALASAANADQIALPHIADSGWSYSLPGQSGTIPLYSSLPLTLKLASTREVSLETNFSLPKDWVGAMGILFYKNSMAMKVYINDCYVDSFGRMGPDFFYQPYLSAGTLVSSALLKPQNTLKLVLYNDTGTFNLRKLDFTDESHYRKAVLGFDFFDVQIPRLCSALLLFVTLCSLIFYFNYREKREILFLALASVFFAMYLLNVTIADFPMGYISLMAILDSAFPISILFIFLFFNSFLEMHAPKLLLYPVLALGLVFAAGYYFQSDTLRLDSWHSYMLLYPFMAIIYGLFGVASELRKKEIDKIAILIGLAVAAVFSTYDMYFYLENKLQVVLLQGIGFMFLLIGIFYSFTVDFSHKAKLQKKELLEKQRHIEILNQELRLQNNSFSRFVPTQFLGFLGKGSAVDIKLGDSSMQNLSLLFSNIRHFNPLSEEILLQENFEILNSYLLRMGRAVSKSNGFISKYLGDSILALFPVEEDTSIGKRGSAEMALSSAMEMRKELVAFNEYLCGQGFCAIDIGIGINTGNVMMGTVGNQDSMDTTVIGDAVNIASRLESLTKFYQAPTIVAEETLASLKDPKKFSFRQVDKIAVKGLNKPIKIYELLDGAASVGAEKLAYAGEMDAAMSLYYARDFEAALRLFQIIHQNNHYDFLPSLFAERCKNYLKMPPPDSWDGVFRLSLRNPPVN